MAVPDDNGVIRIGSIGSQASTYIAGIWNNTPNVTNLLVCVDANGDLGTTGCTNTPSSRRFKDEISKWAIAVASYSNCAP